MQETRHVTGERLRNLLSGPLGRGVMRHVYVQDAPAIADTRVVSLP